MIEDDLCADSQQLTLDRSRTILFEHCGTLGRLERRPIFHMVSEVG